MRNRLFFAFIIAFFVSSAFAQTTQPNTDVSKFRQLGQELPTPNTYRTASGAPGHQYWQQRADYNISAELNDENQSLKGTETITYTNLSPDKLIYLWVQLDQNIFDKESITALTKTGEIKDRMSFSAVEYMQQQGFDGGFKIESVRDAKTNKALKYTINKTMMRVDLPQTLNPKGSYSFTIKWHHNINNQKQIGGRSGYEYFEKDGNYLYEMAQWFPRMAVYDDVNGWQHKQYIGRGEFALPFGDYKVSHDRSLRPCGYCHRRTAKLRPGTDFGNEKPAKESGNGQKPDINCEPGGSGKERKKPQQQKENLECLRPKTCAILPGPAPANLSGMPWA